MAEVGEATSLLVADEDGPIYLKPTIVEVIRTQFCSPLRLLIDKVHVVQYGEGEGASAYRLWLSDGERSIQGIPRREIHPFLASQEINEGTIAVVDKYRLSKASKLSGEGEVWVLLIETLQPVGHDGRTTEDFRIEHRAVSEQAPKQAKAIADGSYQRLLTGLEDGLSSSSSEIDEQPPSPSEVASRKRRPAGPSTPSKRPEAAQGSANLDTPTQRARRASNPSASAGIAAPAGSTQLRQITRPLKITPLARIIGPKATRNRVIDVLGIVVDVSPHVVQRPKMPDQRDLRIMDPSTPKRVQLTVFVDAARFAPAVGTVMLFRSVTTHEWNGGSLKAYPRDCDGREWCFPNPTWLDGFDPEELRAWWLQTVAREEEERQQQEQQQQRKW